MKRKILLTVTFLALLLALSTVVVAFASEGATGGTRAADGYFEIYTSDPDRGAAPAYVETASKELAAKLQEYVGKGDTWIKLNSDATLSFSAIYQFTNSLYIDLGGHKLTLGSGNTDKTLSPCGALGQVLEIKNGTLTSLGAKVIYPIGADAKPDIRFTDLTVDVTADFSDHRAGGRLTFLRCVINFNQNSQYMTACNRFIFFGQRSGIGEIEVEVKDTVFNVSDGFTWANSSSAIFNFGNSYQNETTLTISGSTFNYEKGTLPKIMANGNAAPASVTVTDTAFYGEAPLITSSSTAATAVNIGDGVSVNKKSLDGSVLNANASIVFPADYLPVWLDNENIEYVSPENAVNVIYLNGDEVLGERLSKVGSLPFWDITLDLDGALVYSGGVLYTAGVGFFSDAELQSEVTAITKETASLYVGAGAGEPCAWAAFSSATPSLESLVAFSKEDNEIISAVNDTSVVLIEGYGDITLTHTAAPYSLTRNLTVDAKGNELNLAADNTDKAFNPQSGVTLTLKNATVVASTARLAYPGAKPTNVVTSIVLENVKASWTSVTMFDYRAGGEFIARGCEFDFESNVTFAFNVFTRRSGLSLDMLFEDCIINTDAKLSTPFITLSENADGCSLNVVFNGCSFNALGGQPIISNKSTTSTLNVVINGSEGANPTYVNASVPVLTAVTGGSTSVSVGCGVYLKSPLDGASIQNASLTYAEGAKTVNSSNTEYPYLVTDKYVTVTFKNGGAESDGYYQSGYIGRLDSSKTYVIVNEDGVNKVAEQATAWRDANGELISEFIPEDGMVVTGESTATGRYAAWAIFNSTQDEVVSHSLLDGNSDAMLPPQLATLIPEGGILRLYADATYTVSGSGVHNITLAKDSTVDLGGHKLTVTDARFMNSSSEGHGFTVKNGTLDVTPTANNVLFSNIGARGQATFDSVTLVTKEGTPPFDIRGGGLYLTDCNYDGASVFLYLSARYTVGAPIYVFVEDCDVKSADFITVSGSATGSPAGPYTPDIDVIVNDTVIECAYLFTLNGAITSDAACDLIFDGVRVKGSKSSLFYLAVDATVNASFTDCAFSHDPTEAPSGYALDSVVLPNGLAIIPTDSYEYPFEVGVPVFVKWNIALYNDIRINLFVSGEQIGYIRLDGEDCPLDGLACTDNGYALSIEFDEINRCAEAFEIEIGYGNGYTVSYTLSISDYATGILESLNTEKTKRLVAAALGYVHAAYKYAASLDATAPNVPDSLASLIASDAYLEYSSLGDDTLGEGVSIGGITTAIRSAQLSLGAAIKFRFNIRDGYTGTVTVGATAFDLIDGMDKRTGLTYVEVEANAFSLVGAAISVSGRAADGTEFFGEYSLATYIGAVRADASGEAGELLDAIKAYSLAAYAYKTERDILDGFVYEKRGSSYVITGANGIGGIVEIPEIYNGFYVTEITAYAFCGNTDITGVIIPSSIKTVGIGAFMDCTSLTSLTLSEGVEVIAARAFENTAIRQLTIPDSTAAIGMGAFMGCEAIESLTLPFVGAYRADSNNYLGYIFGAPSYVANAEYVPDALKTVIFSDNATRVPAYSFWGCSNITKIVLGDGVKAIGVSAFSGCEMLTSIYIPEAVTSIPAAGYYYNSPFYGCSENLVICTESADISAFGKYWSNLAEDKYAQVVNGIAYEEYLRLYEAENEIQ
ncbi:MAG: leucine-rich repeat domain-containing protein [Clostridia bacterium]|nr:leucine-rich repeat domain-containing protein [Clostridia bacterium]